MELAEPAKEPAGDAPGGPWRGRGDARPAPRREALAVCWNTGDGQAYRAVVSLADDAVVSWEHLPGQQPNMTVDEWHECDEMLRGHPRLAAALARRGITDLSLVLTDVWAYPPSLVPERYRGLRLGWSDVWCRGSEQGSPYAHHLSGLHPIVDLNRMELLELEDAPPGGDPTDRPEVMGEYLPKLIGDPAARRAAAARQPARGRLVHARRLPAVLAELAAAAGLQLPGRAGPAHRRVHRQRAPQAGRAPALVRRDGGSRTGTSPPTTSAGPRSTSANGVSG